MKRFMVLVVVCSLSAGLAGAASMWGVNLAYWDTSDAGDSFGPGMKFGLEMAPGARLDLRTAYFGDFGEGDIGEDDNGNGVELEVIPLEAGLSLVRPLAEGLDGTAGAGFGYYLMDGSGGADPDNEIGFYASLGLDWALAGSGAVYGETYAGLFGEVLYRAVDANDVKGPGRDGDLNGFGVNAGVMIRW